MNSINTTQQTDQNDDIDLLQLLSVVIDYRWLIIGITATFMFFSVLYATLATPIYQASATVQIEDKSSTISGIEGMDDLFGSKSQAATEIEIIKSRMILGKTVDNLKLNILISPNRFPVIGNYLARKFSPSQPNEVASALLGLNKYDWGGATIDIAQLVIPNILQNTSLTLIAHNQQHFSLYNADVLLADCEVGKLCEGNGLSIFVNTLYANDGTQFTLIQTNRLSTVLGLQSDVQASERSKQTGMIGLTLNDSDAELAKNILNEVIRLYVEQNVARTSQEAANSLAFLQRQMPEVLKEMEKAEQKLNDYQVTAKSADITSETQSILTQLVSIEGDLSDLKLKQLEMDKRFTSSHPLYQVLLAQINTLQNKKAAIEEKVKTLPQTQQELFSLQRDLKVSSEIYASLQQKSQELDITRASTVGNARIIDDADVDTSQPIAPKSLLIVLIGTILGGILSIITAFLHSMLHRGVEDPNEIEAMGLPVYASVPFSDLQTEAETKFAPLVPLLAIEYPHDNAIESIHSLHASLHFALLETPNNIIMMSGPSPGVGKSFVSVNLATVMANAGKKVLLIDADMRRGYLHKFLGHLHCEKGLSTVLAKKDEFNSAVLISNVANLSLLARGAVPPNPTELLLSHYFETFINQVSKDFDIVIIDTPPILAVADALAVGKIAGASFIITHFGKNPAGEIRACIKRFETNGIKVKGAIMNGVRKKLSNTYIYQNYNYNYNYEYKSDKE